MRPVTTGRFWLSEAGGKAETAGRAESMLKVVSLATCPRAGDGGHGCGGDRPYHDGPGAFGAGAVDAVDKVVAVTAGF